MAHIKFITITQTPLSEVTGKERKKKKKKGEKKKGGGGGGEGSILIEDRKLSTSHRYLNHRALTSIGGMMCQNCRGGGVGLEEHTDRTQKTID